MSNKKRVLDTLDRLRRQHETEAQRIHEVELAFKKVPEDAMTADNWKNLEDMFRQMWLGV